MLPQILINLPTLPKFISCQFLSCPSLLPSPHHSFQVPGKLLMGAEHKKLCHYHYRYSAPLVLVSHLSTSTIGLYQPCLSLSLFYAFYMVASHYTTSRIALGNCHIVFIFHRETHFWHNILNMEIYLFPSFHGCHWEISHKSESIGITILKLGGGRETLWAKTLFPEHAFVSTTWSNFLLFDICFYWICWKDFLSQFLWKHAERKLKERKCC